MAVDPRLEGQGIGRSLVRRLLDEAAGSGLLQIVLTVSEDNAAARGLYESCGFSVWGREARAVVVDGQPVAKLHLTVALD